MAESLYFADAHSYFLGAADTRIYELDRDLNLRRTGPVLEWAGDHLTPLSIGSTRGRLFILDHTTWPNHRVYEVNPASLQVSRLLIDVLSSTDPWEMWAANGRLWLERRDLTNPFASPILALWEHTLEGVVVQAHPWLTTTGDYSERFDGMDVARAGDRIWNGGGGGEFLAYDVATMTRQGFFWDPVPPTDPYGEGQAYLPGSQAKTIVGLSGGRVLGVTQGNHVYVVGPGSPLDRAPEASYDLPTPTGSLDNYYAVAVPVDEATAVFAERYATDFPVAFVQVDLATGTPVRRVAAPTTDADNQGPICFGDLGEPNVRVRPRDDGPEYAGDQATSRQRSERASGHGTYR